MTRLRVPILVVSIVLLGAAPAVRADLHPAVVPAADAVSGASSALPTDGIATPPAAARLPADPAEILFRGGASWDWLHDSSAGPVASLPSGSADPPGPREVRDLPPLPGSAGLFLSAMLSIGGWHMVRSARHIHLGALPEWYHAGGPAQVGHAVPCNLDFSAWPLCCFEQPVGERPCLYRVRRQHTPRCDAQCLLIIAAPRGPPSPSF